MGNRRSNRQCAELLYAALQPDHCYSRVEILSIGILSADEFGRARRVLLDAGVLYYKPTRIFTKPAYSLTGKPFSLSDPLTQNRQLSIDQRFYPLLEAWKIRLPLNECHNGNRISSRFHLNVESAEDSA